MKGAQLRLTALRPSLLPTPACRLLPAVRHNSTTKPPPNFYTLFPTAIPKGAPPAGPFDVDLRALQREFFSLQQQSHPDTPAHRRTLSLPSSAYINKAYTTLKDPLLRAQYLLATQGIDIEDETLKMDDQEILMEVIETQEEIEEVSTEAELEPIKEKNKIRIEETVKNLAGALEAADWDKAKGLAVRLRYWRNVEETLKHWEKGGEVRLIH
ncbi:hypothetical protein BZA77DRAFT_310836 [Pyronema omphalodes]|nr:hypothetical protein BZA77DRAFT_310836 [Pyronema omphalodes]